MNKFSSSLCLAALLSTSLSAKNNWRIDSNDEWKAATSQATELKIDQGLVQPQAKNAQFSSIIKTFDEKQKLDTIQFKQSPIWDNWEQIDDITPKGLGNAYVFLPVAPGDYYILAQPPRPKVTYPKGLSKTEKKKFLNKYYKENPDKKPSGGYDAWHSTDLKSWTHCGPISKSKWVTTAEYADGKFYIYYDEPNDQDPHLIIDENLKDGKIGKEMGKVFDDPSHGSDIAAFRDEDGTFHLIYEDWSPINAQQNAWDSPLAGRVSSPDGINGFTFGQHPNIIDHRTTPTGKKGTFKHGATKAVNGTGILEYEIHEPKQNAYGDYSVIKIGEDYHIFCDYDPADHSQNMRMGRFTGNDLNKEFTWSGSMGDGFHPDPSVGFAEGKFYAVMQKETDFMSSGPWLDGVEARAGADSNGDGKIDQWTDWQKIKESYSQKPGFARIVDVEVASLNCSDLAASQSFQFEFRTSGIHNKLKNEIIHPVIDRVELNFK
ncbi:hypothetical protein PQO03_14320 [Lentisphaera profundi]|uniref:Uncharacterized protein n=1 Tax=Lentisphaera profundi TaxID=1658616 RepID=A0ABY7W221_9BACT|nr:hypothetical protein [Lentisphaera profundi]WDE99009.1 hypothetical protein PQO03_14320 [Lentisphaera profundi]